MPIFYGVYFANPELAAALDLVRFFAEPDYYRRTHITIRGPYEQRLSTSQERKIEHIYSKSGRLLQILGVGSFFFGKERSGQNTVFLKCELDGAEHVWKKPDFSDGKPHITLYDGSSREFGMAIRHLLQKYSWNFSTKTTNIELLEKKRDPAEYLTIFFRNAQSLCDRLFGDDVSISKFELLREYERLYLIDKVVFHIHAELLKGRSFIY